MDIEILELCKENIQPLRKGRNTHQLGLALKAVGNVELQARLLSEREEYELGIITYDGPDPLQPRLDYMVWLEQTYIKHGRECNLIPLLEDTITAFKDNPIYKQDPRLIDLVVKYIEAQENAVELFQMVYSQGLGTMCATLYRYWAEVLDQSCDFKRADQVYQLGIANRAEPVEMLKEAHSQFQLSIGRRMMLSGGDLHQQTEEEQLPDRQVLGKLKKGVSSVRNAHGSAGTLSVKSSKASTSKKQISVFQDSENNYEHLISAALQKNKIGSIATSCKNNEENRMKPGTWNKGYNKKEMSTIPTVPSTPSFKVHIDPETETPKLAAKTPSNVLKTRKAELISTNAMEVFNPSQSKHKPIQCNLVVYAGGREFCFEELRLAFYKKKEQIKNSEKELLAELTTPAKYMINEPSTSHTSENWRQECDTPLTGVNNPTNAVGDTKTLILDECSKVQDISPSTNEKGFDEACFKTPLKHLTGFAPITPSLQGIDLSEFVETPIETTQPLKPLNNHFNIFVDEDCSTANYTVANQKSGLLPIPEENETSPKVVKKNGAPKKVLFSKKEVFEIPIETILKPLTNQFSIFVDEDCTAATDKNHELVPTPEENIEMRSKKSQ